MKFNKLFMHCIEQKRAQNKTKIYKKIIELIEIFPYKMDNIFINLNYLEGYILYQNQIVRIILSISLKNIKH